MGGVGRSADKIRYENMKNMDRVWVSYLPLLVCLLHRIGLLAILQLVPSLRYMGM